MDAELVERLNQPLNRPVPWIPWLAFQTVGTIAAAREQTRAGAVRLVEHLHPRMPLHRYRGSERCQMRWLPLLGFAFLCQAAGVAEEMTPPAETGPVPWRADHHMHLASADICERVGDCLPDRDPPTVLAADAVRALFDLSYVPAPEQGTDTVAALRREMRRIGLERFLFGSDYNVLTPAGQIAALARLDLADEEESILRTNCAPWVCPDGGESSEPEP